MYLLREIVIEREDRVVHSLTQRIGWDPLTKRLKGWTFDADGSVGESYWTQQGDTWVVQTSGVTARGRDHRRKNRLQRDFRRQLCGCSTDAQVGSESKPGFELHFKRLPADQ